MRSCLFSFCFFIISCAANATDRTPGLTAEKAVEHLSLLHMDQTNLKSVFVKWDNRNEKYEITRIGKIIGVSALILGAAGLMPAAPGAVLTATWCFVPKFWSLCQISLPMFLAPIGIDLVYGASAYAITSPIYNIYAKTNNARLCELSLGMLDNVPEDAVISFDDYPEIIPYIFDAPHDILGVLSLGQVLSLAKADISRFETLLEKNAFGQYEQKQAKHYLNILKMNDENRSNVLKCKDVEIDKLVIEQFQGQEIRMTNVAIDTGDSFLPVDEMALHEKLKQSQSEKLLRKKLDIYFLYSGIPSSLAKEFVERESPLGLANIPVVEWKFCTHYKLNMTKKKILDKISLEIDVERDENLFKVLGQFDEVSLKTIFANYSFYGFKKKLEAVSDLRWYGDMADRYKIQPLIDVIAGFCRDDQNKATVRGAWQVVPEKYCLISF
jgi:hypothetical protein